MGSGRGAPYAKAICVAQLGFSLNLPATKLLEHFIALLVCSGGQALIDGAGSLFGS